jgi:hypothetical protein
MARWPSDPDGVLSLAGAALEGEPGSYFSLPTAREVNDKPALPGISSQQEFHRRMADMGGIPSKGADSDDNEAAIKVRRLRSAFSPQAVFGFFLPQQVSFVGSGSQLFHKSILQGKYVVLEGLRRL